MRAWALAASLALHAVLTVAVTRSRIAWPAVTKLAAVHFDVVEVQPEPPPPPAPPEVSRPSMPTATRLVAPLHHGAPEPPVEPPAEPQAMTPSPLPTDITLTDVTTGGVAVPTRQGLGSSKRPTAIAAAATSASTCSEPPSKPRPLERLVDIEYTPTARQRGVQGRLVLQAHVDMRGVVRRVEVLASVDAELDAAAVAAVKTWRFEPAKRCGVPMDGGTFTLARRFELGT